VLGIQSFVICCTDYRPNHRTRGDYGAAVCHLRIMNFWLGGFKRNFAVAVVPLRIWNFGTRQCRRSRRRYRLQPHPRAVWQAGELHQDRARHWADRADSFFEKVPAIKLDGEMVALATQLIKQKASEEFKPEKYRNHYVDAVRQHVKEKAKGQKIVGQAHRR
jgi:hypothetical protein